jgi:hypothetical protein
MAASLSTTLVSTENVSASLMFSLAYRSSVNPRDEGNIFYFQGRLLTGRDEVRRGTQVPFITALQGDGRRVRAKPVHILGTYAS